MIDILRRLRGEIAIANKAAAAERERIAKLADTWGHSTFAQFLRGIKPCSACHGLGYDASGQHCSCQP